MGNTNNTFRVWPLMPDELAPPEPPQKHSAIEDDTIISYGGGEYTFGLTLEQVDSDEASAYTQQPHHLDDSPSRHDSRHDWEEMMAQTEDHGGLL